MIKKIFIIVPSAVNDSPIKGAAALANALNQWAFVVFVTLKQSAGNFDFLGDDIEHVRLGEYNWHVKIKMLRELLKSAGNSSSIATVSCGISADFTNSLCTDLATTCASVRGNLPVVYVNTYGVMGKLAAYFHFRRLRGIDQVVSMTDEMSRQVQGYIKKKSPVIGNFIDEKPLLGYRKKEANTGTYQLIFLGSLIFGKQPLTLINVMAALIDKGHDAKLDIFGDGPLLNNVKSRVDQLGINNKVTLHGYVDNVYAHLEKADVLILPSLSEGVSRAALEALFLGIPCVLRDVDGASELIQAGVNGYLFKDDFELNNMIIRAIELSRSFSGYRDLLPEGFRQQHAAKKYLKLLESGV